MLRLFLLSMAFMFFLSMLIGGWLEMVKGETSIIVIVFIGGSGAIPFGVMLVKHIIGIFKK